MTDPVSVFISRKTGRLYIRQARHPVADMAIAIKEPAQPIGTHVFTVMDTPNGGSSARWNVVNVQVPAGVGQIVKETDRRGRVVQRIIAPSAQVLGKAALDRIELPEAALERITPYLQAGSSLIVSDLGPSVETGQGTDFVVQIRGEEASIASQIKYAKERAAEKAQQLQLQQRWSERPSSSARRGGIDSLPAQRFRRSPSQ